MPAYPHNIERLPGKKHLTGYGRGLVWTIYMLENRTYRAHAKDGDELIVRSSNTLYGLSAKLEE